MSLALPPPWPFQAATVWAATEILAAEESNGGGVLVQSPTGSGKTRMGLGVAAWALGRGLDVVWLVPRDELLKQAVRALNQAGVLDLCIIRKGRVEGNPSARIVVASIQTLVSRRFAPRAGGRVLVVLDEARHYVAAEWGQIATAYQLALLLGLDATPCRDDGRPLGRSSGGLFGRLLVAASVQELQAGGYLVQDVHVAPEEHDGTLAVDPVEMLFQHEGKMAPWAGRRTIFFCGSRELARQRAAAISSRGLSAEAVDSTSGDAARASAIERFRSGALPVLCNVRLFTEGLDVPELDTVVIDTGVSSEASWIQMLGRGARRSDGKDRFWVLDPYGHFRRFGLFHDPRDYSLDGQAIQRAAALPTAVQCRACLGWRRGAVCACGAELPLPPTPRVRARDVREVLEAKPEAVKLDVLKRMAARERDAGRDPWRAVHRFRGSYGAISDAKAREVISTI